VRCVIELALAIAVLVVAVRLLWQRSHWLLEYGSIDYLLIALALGLFVLAVYVFDLACASLVGLEEPTMAGFTVAQLEAIETALASGELTVEYDGKRVTYRSATELLTLRDRIRDELVASGAITDTTPRRSYGVHSRS
jgi:hypothetical protein